MARLQPYTTLPCTRQGKIPTLPCCRPAVPPRPRSHSIPSFRHSPLPPTLSFSLLYILAVLFTSRLLGGDEPAPTRQCQVGAVMNAAVCFVASQFSLLLGIDCDRNSRHWLKYDQVACFFAAVACQFY